MKLGIRYETSYRYTEPVAFSLHEIRLFPRVDLFTLVERMQFEANAGATVRFGRDVYDNCVASCSFTEPANELRFHLELDLALQKKNPFDFLLRPDAVCLPFTYSTALRHALAPYLRKESGPPLALPRWVFPQASAPRPTVTVLVELNERLHECVGYERREEGPPFRPRETLRRGRGACRDVALLMAALLRQMGLAARLTSGYLREAESEARRAEGSLHAWTEVYLPGAGWLGLDATNGVFANHNFIAAAVGITPAEVTPIDGSFAPRLAATPQMTSRLELVSLGEAPDAA